MVRESVNLLELLRKQAAGGDLDFLREAVAVLAEAVMEAEVAAQAGAGYGERSPGAHHTGATASMRDGPIRKADVAASSGGAAFRRPRSGVARDVR